MSERVAALALDTSAYSHFRRGHPDTLDWVASAQTLLLPTVVVGELLAGFELGERRAENVSVLEQLLDEPFTVIVPVDKQVSRAYGKLFAELKRAGRPLPINDVWIAATAIANGAPLLTFDRDFEGISSLDSVLLST